MAQADVNAWRKSSWSGTNGGSCVEVGKQARAVAVRDTTQSNDPNRTVVEFSDSTWSEFLDTLK